MAMELAVTDHRKIELALKASKETILNGQMQDIEDANITNREICHLCGKLLTLDVTVDNDVNGKMRNSSVCDDCMTPTESLKIAEEQEEVANKRDSGFHTLKRDESDLNAVVDTGQAEPTLSSASSADSAVSMGTNSEDTTPNDDKHHPLPRITVDECNNTTSTSKNDSKVDFDIGDNVFDDISKLPRSSPITRESPKQLAEKLFKFDGYKRTEIARLIGKNSDYHREAGREYLKFFNFSHHSVLDAYREFLTHFALLGETQERERVLAYFSERYVECNPDFLDQNPDSVHTLVCALTLLNTDLHGNIGLGSGRKKMTYKQFALNLSGLMADKSDYPKDLLVAVYTSIKKHPLPWGGKEQKSKVQRSSSTLRNGEPESGRTLKKIVNRSQSTRSLFKPVKLSTDQSRAGLGRSANLKPLSENHGLLWRKALLDSDGKKVSLGKRAWKVYLVTLQNLELHIVKKGSNEAKTLSVHHCLAERSTTESKRSHVFKLTLADSSVTLYQASSDKEVENWIHDINKAAALMSAAPLCSPIGSQLIFRKPLLPSAPSTLPPSNQLNKLCELLKENEEDLIETRRFQQNEKLPSEQTVQYYQDKITYLLYEVKKYETYTKILQVHLRGRSSDSTGSDDPRSNLETTENGSLVSVTPSEPPLASPSALDAPENFPFPGTPTSVASETCDQVLSPPTHLLSPQHRSLTLTPTSSLPNLSPILESPTRGLMGNNQVVGSLRRRHVKEMYESSLNDGEGLTMGNMNNSNWVTTPRGSSPDHEIGSLRYKVGIQTTVDVNVLPGGREPFPVRRYEMRIAEMSPELVPETQHEPRTRLVGRSAIDTPTRNLPENLTLSRVKGRKEKKGIERYSYMQAVSPFEGSY